MTDDLVRKLADALTAKRGHVPDCVECAQEALMAAEVVREHVEGLTAAIDHLHDDVGTLTSDLSRARDRITELEARPCPHVVTSDEGTSYCTLAFTTADQIGKLQADLHSSEQIQVSTFLALHHATEQVSHLRTALTAMPCSCKVAVNLDFAHEDDNYHTVLCVRCAALADSPREPEGTTEFDEEPISADQVRERLGLEPREP